MPRGAVDETTVKEAKQAFERFMRVVDGLEPPQIVQLREELDELQRVVATAEMLAREVK
jgi:hypothetical protein